MKKRMLIFMLAGTCILAAAGCGKKEEAQPEEVQQETVQEDVEETVEEETQEQATTGSMSREEFVEKYYKPMEELKSEYESCTDPDEIEHLAQEYNKLALESMDVYAETMGGEMSIDFIPRRQYLVNMAYYSGARDYFLQYDDVYISYTDEGDMDEEVEKEYDNFIIKHENGNVTINPEVSDSILFFTKDIPDDNSGNLESFCLVYDGGKTILQANISDYTDAGVRDIQVFGNTVVFLKSDGNASRIIFNWNGKDLEKTEEYYSFDDINTIPEIETNGYICDEIFWNEFTEPEDGLRRLNDDTAFSISR